VDIVTKFKEIPNSLLPWRAPILGETSSVATRFKATPASRSPSAFSRIPAPRALLPFVCFLTATFLLLPPGAFAQDTPKKLLAIIDYISSDYKNAVQDGKVLNQSEYQEQLEFSRRSLELLDELTKSGGDRANIQSEIKLLVSRIEAKADPKVIADTANGIEQKIMAAYDIVPYPRQIPTFAAGKQLFMENCAQCHGEAGEGDGPGRQTMNPKEPPPAKFTDPEFMSGLSPFKAFNALSFGVENTAMASWAALSEAQRWDLAFYVFSLRFSDEAAKRGEQLSHQKGLPPEFSQPATLATTSDGQLAEKLKTRLPQESDQSAVLAYLRRGLLQKPPADPLAVARARLRESSELYASGDKQGAYQKAVDAYIDGFDLAEPALFAKDLSFGRDVETQFTEFRNAIKMNLPAAEIEKRRQDLEAKLDQAAEIIARDDSFSEAYSFTNSALIILREGLEAALIIAAIIAMLKVMGASAAIRYIHLGWISALGLGILTWLATQSVLTLSGRSRESMEGFISVFAAVALFYVGYWLHTRAEAKKWREFIQQKVSSALSGRKILGLMGISFFAVYREAFEVVLFYQALWLQTGSSHAAILWGFVAGLAALLVATFAIVKLGLKIPLKYFFGATGTLLYIMAFVFAGNGIKELQAAGWMPSTPIRFAPQVPLLGIYPTLQTLAAQAVMILAFIASTYYLVRERSKA
jgi:high-affinity iron transporter